MTSYTDASILLGCAALVAFLIVSYRAVGERSGGLASSVALALLSVVALVVHLGVLEQNPETGERSLRPPPPHLRELYHYFLGTKYFAELGYDGLYDATVVADQVDDFAHFSAGAAIRDLRTYEGVSRAAVVQRGPEIRGHFSPERWELFRQDVEMFRAAVGHEWWQQQEWLHDRGYNGTPVVTALLGGLANLVPENGGGFLNAARWADLALFPLVLAAVLVLHGSRVALVFAFVWFINPFNDYNFVGGAYLRYTYVYCLALAFACASRGRGALAGFFLALGTGLRVFPALFAAGVVLNHLARPGRRAALRERAPFYGAFALTCLALVGATWFVRAPDGRAGWPAFVDNMQLHAGAFGGNQVGLAMPIVFDSQNRISEERGSDDWAASQEARAEQRRIWIRLATAAALAALVAAARKLDFRHSLLLGLPLLFVLQPAAHYYYAMLGLVPLLFLRERAAQTLLAAGFLVTLVTFWPGWLGAMDRVFAVASVELGLLLAALVAVACRSSVPPHLSSEEVRS